MAAPKIKVHTDDKSWQDLLKRITHNADQLKSKPYVDVGVLDGTEPTGTSSVLVATVHEYGAPAKGIPSRSFIRSTVYENREGINDAIAKLQHMVLYQGNVKGALRLLGAYVQKLTRDKLEKQDPNWDKLSDATLKRKAEKGDTGGGVKILIDSGSMLRNVTYKVGGGDE